MAFDNFGYFEGGIPAYAIPVNTENFAGLLSSLDIDLQKALDTLDDVEIYDGGNITKPTTVTSDQTFTYSGGNLTNVTYSDGTEKDFTYNGDGTLNTVTITYPTGSPVVKTFSYSGGNLSGITVS